MPLNLISILIGLFLLVLAIYLKYTIIPMKKNKSKKRKYYNPNNNYFRNSPEHIDMTKSYIDSIWEEIRKK